MITIDALGQPCPIPVVKARQAVVGLPPQGGVVSVLVDNAVACQNLAKMAEGSGYSHKTQQRPDGVFAFTITVGEGRVADSSLAPPPPSGGGGLAVAIGSDAMGRGSEELGKLLIKGFLFSLSELPEPPEALLFFNGGVHLAVKDANTVEDLQGLAAKGTRILVCGTCADYYGCREQIAVGEIADMYGITQAMSAAGRLLSL